MGDLRVLVTGGTGYIGQFVLEELSRLPSLSLAYTHARPDAPRLPPAMHAFRVQLHDRDSVVQCIRAVRPDVVVHTAAMSALKACQHEPELARAVNCPGHLLDALAESSPQAHIYYLSTEQVYDGAAPPFDEASPTHPVNTYGETKLEFERMLAARWPAHTVLRIANTVGPEAPFAPIPAPKFLQWLLSALQAPPVEGICLFEDEVRSFVYVRDIARAVAALVARHTAGHDVAPAAASLPELFVVGGPQAASRVQAGRVVLAVLGLEEGFVRVVDSTHHDRYAARYCRRIRACKRAESALASLPSPPDLTLRSDKLEHAVGFKFLPLSEAVRLSLAGEAAVSAT